jgi:hypothetical protein
MLSRRLLSRVTLVRALLAGYLPANNQHGRLLPFLRGCARHTFVVAPGDAAEWYGSGTAPRPTSKTRRNQWRNNCHCSGSSRTGTVLITCVSARVTRRCRSRLAPVARRRQSAPGGDSKPHRNVEDLFQVPEASLATGRSTCELRGTVSYAAVPKLPKSVERDKRVYSASTIESRKSAG